MPRRPGTRRSSAAPHGLPVARAAATAAPILRRLAKPRAWASTGGPAAVAMSPMKPPTRAEQIRTTLSDDIVHGRLRPGDALDEASLAQRFAVSRTPIREAIRQLEANGFAEARPRRGAV